MIRYIIFTMLLLCNISVFAQSNNTDDLYFYQKDPVHKVIPSSGIGKYEYYSKKSAKCQYTAMAFTTLSVGCFAWYASKSDRYNLEKDGEVKMKDSAKYLLIGGSVSAAAAILSEIIAINFKTKARNNLKMTLSASGIDVALRF